MRKMFEGVILVAVFLAAGGTLFQNFSEQLRVNEAVISIATAVIAALIGAWSLDLARFAKKIPNRPRIFLSYSHKDTESASKLREALIKEGAFVWSYDTNFRAGHDFQASIASAIESSNSVVLIISSPMSTSVRSELEAALQRNVPVLVLAPSAQEMSEVSAAKHVFPFDSNHANFDAIAAELVHATGGRSASEATR